MGAHAEATGSPRFDLRHLNAREMREEAAAPWQKRSEGVRGCCGLVAEKAGFCVLNCILVIKLNENNDLSWGGACPALMV